MMIGHFTASVIAHYHTSNMVIVSSDCTLGEPQSHLATLIYKILGKTISMVNNYNTNFCLFTIQTHCIFNLSVHTLHNRSSLFCQVERQEIYQVVQS